MTFTAKAAEYKKGQVAAFAKLMREYPVVGLVNVENLPSRQFQILRKKLRKDVLLVMGKTQFIRMAIDDVKDSKAGFIKLSDSMEGMPALLFTTQNPFKISTLIRASKSKAPAKPGQVAPYDLVIPAGPTPFTPGPIISELGSVGLKTGVENGKVTIREASTIVRTGEVVSKKASEVLAKFGIEPMQVGLDLVAAYEDGIVYGRNVLSIDAEQYLTMLKTAAAEALGLSIEIGYVTKGNIERFIGKAFNTAKNFAISQNILSSALLEKEFGDAVRAAESMAESAGISATTDAPEEQKEEKREELKPEPAAERKEAAKKEGSGGAKMVVEEKKQKTMADKIGEDFKEEIEAEKKLRESVDSQATEELVGRLKKKGTLRQ